MNNKYLKEKIIHFFRLSILFVIKFIHHALVTKITSQNEAFRKKSDKGVTVGVLLTDIKVTDTSNNLFVKLVFKTGARYDCLESKLIMAQIWNFTFILIYKKKII